MLSKRSRHVGTIASLELTDPAYIFAAIYSERDGRYYETSWFLLVKSAILFSTVHVGSTWTRRIGGNALLSKRAKLGHLDEIIAHFVFSTDRSVFLRRFRCHRSLISAVTKYDYRDRIGEISNEIGRCTRSFRCNCWANNVKQFYRIVWQHDSFLTLSCFEARLAVAWFDGHCSKVNVLIKGRTLAESNQLTRASFVLGVGWKCVPSDTNDGLPAGWQWKSEISLDLRMATVLPSGTEVALAPGFFH